MATESVLEASASSSSPKIPILVDTCTGIMGRAVIATAVAAGLYVVPVSFGREEQSGHNLHISGIDFFMHGPSNRESVLRKVLRDYPNLIVVDYTVPTALNGNAELYCKIGVPFVMGTTGGDMDLLCKTVEDSKTYALIPSGAQKPVNAFLAALKIMEEECPGSFSAYSFGIVASKVDASGIANTVFSFANELGLSYNQITKTGNTLQLELVGDPEDHLEDHSFQMRYFTSTDKKVEVVYGEHTWDVDANAAGAVDAIFFLAKKIAATAQKRVYTTIDMLKEGIKR